jgi:hypothetical protein
MVMPDEARKIAANIASQAAGAGAGAVKLKQQSRQSCATTSGFAFNPHHRFWASRGGPSNHHQEEEERRSDEQSIRSPHSPSSGDFATTELSYVHTPLPAALDFVLAVLNRSIEVGA